MYYLQYSLNIFPSPYPPPHLFHPMAIPPSLRYPICPSPFFFLTIPPLSIYLPHSK